MKIVKKYYNNLGKLRLVGKNKPENSSIIRIKIFRNGKEFPCCDWKGKCTNFAYAEVFPVGSHHWAYLCKKHYYQEQKRLKWKLAACLKVEF